MASYDPYDSPTRERSHRYVEERRESRDPRYGDRESYLKVHSQSLVPRHREDSDLSVEEIRRDFPPLGYPRDIRRARSAEPGPGYYDYDPQDRGFDDHRSRGKKGANSLYYEEEEREKSRRRVLSKQEKIIAAVAGAALAIGGKEIYDRREAKEKHHDIQRNYLQSAALGAASALTVYGGTGLYNKQMGKDDKKSTYILHRGRDGRVSEYYSDDDDDAAAKKGHKSFLESALGVTSLGAAMKAFTGGGDEKEKHRGRGHSDRSRSSSRSRSGGNLGSKIQKSAMAALIAGATEAFRVSKEPGSWKGEKSKRILTAALGAGAIDTAHDSEKHSKLGLAESVIGGLVSNRLMHGSKKNIEEDERTGRSRSRSRARSASRGGGNSRIAALATAGLGALGAKKALESRSSRSRSRSGRRHSVDSDESGGRRRSRSRSVVDSARKSLAKLGIGSNPEDKDRRRRDHDDYDESPRSSRRQHQRRYSDDGYYEDDARGSVRSGRDYEEDRSYRPRRKGGKSDAGSDSDLGASSEDERRAKKMRGKQILTTSLAAVATIHAGHELYQSVEKRNARHKAVKEGRLSPEEAKKLKTKALLQDAASVGIAAMGIKGAVSELKEAKSIRAECKEFREEKALRHEKRVARQRQLSRSIGNGNGNGNGRRRADNWSTSAPPQPDRYGYASHYTDGNPYSATLPAPPVGYDRR